jgi:effector-binding domain-containing protein
MKEKTITNIEVPDMLIASITYKGAYKDAGLYLHQLYETVNSNIDGKPFTIFHGKELESDENIIEICMPLRKQVNYHNIQTKLLKGGEAYSILHIGPYETMTQTYNRLTSFILDHGINYSLSFREHYRKGPGMFFKGNPNKYKTEVIVIL